jgi:hypothetical protein
MSAKEQRRQKKLARKRTKELSEKKSRAREKNSLQSVAGQMKAASAGAVERCLISSDLVESSQKLGTVMITRRMADGRVGCARFLIDGLCLGVKRAEGFACYPGQVTEILEQIGEVESMRPASPAAARKLVEAAIAFAHQFDLEPCANYAKVSAVWGDIDPAACETEFHFGNDQGNPIFVAGPHDTMADTARITAKLEATAGDGNYDVDYEAMLTERFGGNEFDGDDWTDDPELDVDIDEDVVDAVDVQPTNLDSP